MPEDATSLVVLGGNCFVWILETKRHAGENDKSDKDVHHVKAGEQPVEGEKGIIS